jgi:hypothetical protein
MYPMIYNPFFFFLPDDISPYPQHLGHSQVSRADFPGHSDRRRVLPRDQEQLVVDLERDRLGRQRRLHKDQAGKE